ncbi:MAG: DUF3667 domain-containing protein [Alphaproteobacteria bacterium]|nr:MAG: DUF3667 domain-containing protein [Alphaproteobacteria bacterium]
METCRNCGAELTGPWCAACGQKHVPGRLSLPDMARNIAASLTELDSSLWRTVAELSRDPGRVTLNYIAGQRARYIGPVKFFLTVFAFYVFILAVTGTLDYIADDAVHIGEGTDMQSLPVKMAIALQSVLRSHFNLLFFVSLPLLAAAVRWQYWKAGRNYAETLCFLCYIGGIGSLYGALFVLILWLFGTYSGTPRGLVLVVLFTVGARTFFGLSWPRALGGLLITLFFYMICTVLAALALAFLTLAGVF